MCEVCADFQNLLELYEVRVASSDLKFQLLLKSEIETTFNYIQSWPQRQCMCLYRDTKNYDRFNLVVQSLICLTVQHLKHIDHLIDNYKRLTASAAQVVAQAQQQQREEADAQSEAAKDAATTSTTPVTGSAAGLEDGKKEEPTGIEESQGSGDGPAKKPHTPVGPSTPPPLPPPATQKAHLQYTEEPWILPEVEKLLVLVSKVFLLNFPLYIAHKHGMHSRLDDLQAEEAHHLALICDLHDNDLPIYLLRNVSLFCNSGGFGAMSLCFEHPDLPVSTAHSMTAAISNVKLWLNYHCNTQLFVPLRSRILQYMCKLSDQSLRSAATRAMADFVWSSMRDPLDVTVNFDTEGLALAFKYFTSTTLTMRLAGMAQINAHINLFNEICTTETVNEVELFGQRIANWLTENHIVQHLFGPNLHVEIVKQAHVLLNFLAVENQISEEDIKLIWQATQLKHCSKTIYDILPSLVKNLAPRPAMHLYSLLCRMDPKEHTEQSIYIASALTKQLWSRDCSRSQINLMQDHLLGSNVTASSSDSGSIEGSNTEDDHVADDSSIASGGGGGAIIGQKSPIDGVTPCKQARHRRHVCDPTTEKGNPMGAEDMAKVDMVNNRIVNIIDNTSSEEELQSRAALELQLHRSRKKTSNKRRRQKASKQLMLPHELVEIWDGAEDVPSSDEADADGDGDGEGELLADSDECSDGAASQLVPDAVLKHLQGEGPYIRAIETNISELLSGAENDGSYSSPMSNKSEKNLADFDDEDVSPCEEELAQLVSSRANCRDVPPAFAAAAAAMMVAQSAMALQKSGESNVAAAAAAVAAAAAATGNAQQTLAAMNRQASVAAAAAAAVAVAAAAKAKSDSDVDLLEVSPSGGKQHQSPKASQISGLTVQPSFKLNDVCQPGNTLLWDLLQDNKIGQLGESLALEAEKALATLLCFSMDRQLRTKFIEGCLYNVANNRSVIVSLRLLPKLFASFQQFRPSDTHSMTLWAERNHRMMQSFFNNIRHYARRHAEQLATQNGEQPPQQQMYSHKTQVSVRLQFLSSIFSSVGSPKSFRLTLDQLDALWEWLAHDPECADCYFSWLQAQAKGGDQHALGIEALQHLYLKKLPELRPEEFSMVALGLFQQLCSFARIAMAEYDKHSEQISSSASAVGMYHLWKIALRAQSNEVSLAAIQYINMYYMGQQLRLEKEFVSQCMDNLVQTATALESMDDENALMRVQRGLLLLNTHLDTFRRRYAFHLRRWAIEGKGIGSHSNLKNEGAGPPLRIVLQQAGLSEKSVLQMHACDLIADLKAEVSKWWESLQTGLVAPVLGLLLSDGPLRIITQGQELTSDYDERSLGDAGFKDNQIVYVSLGGRGARRKESNLEHPSMLPPPPKECLPTVLLLQPKYFEKLFCLMQTLGDMKPQVSAVNLQHHTKAQLLSRRVWDILAMLPTNPHILDAFKSLVTDLSELEQLDAAGEEEQLATKRKQIKQKFKDLLDPNNLQKFMYSLHIVESLALSSSRRGNESNGSLAIGHSPEQIRVKKCSIGRRRNSNEQQPPPPSTPDSKPGKEQGELEAALTPTPTSGQQDAETEASSSSGGDKENQPKQHSKRQKKGEAFEQQEKERPLGCSTPPSPSPGAPPPPLAALERGDNKWSEAFVKCGGLRHLYEIFSGGQLQQSAHPKELALNEWRHDCLASLLRIIWLLGFEELHTPDVHVLMSQPHTFMLQLMEVPECLARLSSILNDEVYQQQQVASASSLVFPYQFHQLRTGFWGRAQLIQFAMNILVSFVHASAEARRLLWAQADGDHCRWLQKFILEDPEPAVRREICAGLYRICLGHAHSYRLLLVPLLHKLIALLPLAEQMSSGAQHTQFLLSEEGKEPYGPACRDYFWLLARLVDTLSAEMVAEEHIDIEMLCESISQSILTRDYFELRHGFQDDGLVGLLNLMSNLIKYDTTFKYTPKALSFIEQLIGFLFDMPSPADRQKPKCKSGTSRAAAYDLLVELCRGCATNYAYLHGRLLAQHKSGPKQPYPWDYWPRDEGRSECGYVGLTNLGATCYMASCVQHLYMMPQARAAILRVPQLGAQKHGPTLLELQRMFAYLLESERKAYNPRSFCRVYQMDHQPLNTGEQKDMAEFFIDLVSKLEEMTPDLKHLVKRLFSGTLSNNVVSLDCGHVSRTAEEFYTVRCQVADMRNLQESLDEVTVKDTLEGDNMYTCSQCGKKVRAEKRACFKKLPQILCFNTMRYTFNMVTMLKEKVNTHFSFPLRLNMCHYVEKTLMPQQYKEEREKRLKERENDEAESGRGDENDNEKAEASLDADIEECYEYELVGVTVHTGTADGGHYYSFIKERTKNSYHPHERWFLFNDAEVKPFDPSQIAAECFGGEMTSKTYDSVTEKYLDFSFEKTNSAYMLFYERRLPEHLQRRHSELLVTPTPSPTVEEKSEVEEPTKLETSVTSESKLEEDVKVDNEDEDEKDKMKKNEQSAKEDNQMEAKPNEEDLQKTESPAVGKSEQNKLEKKGDTAEEKSSEMSQDDDVEKTTANCDNHKPSNNSHNKASNDPQPSTSKAVQKLQLFRPLLNKELEDWIWQDNRQFLQDRNIFEHTYFNFMWQICGHIPQTLISESDVTCMAAKLSVSFFIETFIHAKEKPTMVPWVELLTKQFNASQEACEWFLSHMSLEPFWPVQVLIQCPNQMVRQMFQRLVIHVIQRLRASHADLYLDVETDEDDKELIGQASCVTRFIGSLISLLEHGARSHLRHLSEYFSLLCEFSRMGDEEAMFLLRIGILKSLVDFYLGNKQTDSIDISSDNEDNSSDEALSVEKMRPASLDKMIALCASLVERSRGADFRLRLSPKDFNAIAGGKGFPFLYQQIKDGINPHQTKHLIHALCRWDERLATQIIGMLFASVTKHTELCAPFFKLLTLLTETQAGPVGLPCFTQLILPRMWDAAEYCPQSVLDWLSLQATKNKIAHTWILQSAEQWLEQFLLAHDNTRVRNAAAFLLVALVPSQPFRANFRAHSQHKLLALNPHSYRDINSDAQVVLHQVITLLLRLLRPARVYADIGAHGTTKLTAYFNLLSYCMVSKTEKLMIGSFMRSLWELFHPRLSEPSVPAHHNKHALLTFWHHSLVDCPENAAQVANCPEITRNIAFNYILADHDDAEIVTYNRSMLPAYYGLLRLCCEQSRALTRQLSQHQNLQWAFKNITPHPTQYAAAVDELFKLMALFATRHPDASEQEKLDVTQFRRAVIVSYTSSLDARVSWSTLISALKILVDNEEDRTMVIFNGGIEMCFEALHTLHSMHHEATACHVAGDLFDLLGELLLLLATLRTRTDSPAQKKQQQQQQQLEQQLQLQQQQMLQKQQQQQQSQSQTQAPQTPQQKEKQLQQQMQQHLQLQQLQQMQFQQQHFLRQQHQHSALAKALPDAVKRLATLLNTFNSPEISRMALEVLKELVRNTSLEAISILAPILINCHLSVANAPNAIGPLGPYFPRRGAKHSPWPLGAKNSPRPPRPMVQMCIALAELTPRGLDAEYDAQVEAFYRPYHDFIDVMMRMCVNTGTLNDTLVKLQCLVAIESTPLHFNYFPKFWVGIHNNALTHKYVELLVKNQLLVEYLHNVLRDERSMLKDACVREFLELYYHKVAAQLPVARMIYTINYGMHSKDDIDELCGDLFAIRIIAQATGVPASVRKELRGSLRALQNKSERFRKESERDQFPNKKQKRETHKDKTKDLAQLADGDDALTSVDGVDKPADVSMETVGSSSNEPETSDGSAKPPTPAGSDDEQMERTSIPSSDDETELEDELEPTPKRNKKASNKKTAQDRLNEDREKRLITLITMESYIQSIFAILKRDSSLSSTGVNKEPNEEGSAEASTSAAAATKASRPKGACTPPEPMPEVSDIRCNMETERDMETEPQSPSTSQTNGSQPAESPAASSSGDPTPAASSTVASTSQAASPTQI
ncbi:ubiquitin carboxyl-terminal hydrolase 34 [Drosophila serrata]|uniref:ubiquitin carboxyl-terminal hydrolase 34 n=1 Tax=Drosophila serrata TaxID=7274 RepID=UPI000A1D14BD|nr:ubiquitin carboxyl-terminal hydrolase 34 [Drosophila serrata]